MHSDSSGKLIRDVLSQDCKNFSFDLKNRIYSFDRKFDTCDVNDYVIKVSIFFIQVKRRTAKNPCDQDRSIICFIQLSVSLIFGSFQDETVHVIWAHGSDKLYSARGLCLPCTNAKNNGFIRVRLLSVPGLPKQHGEQLSITVENVSVPGTDTTYWCKVVQLPSYITETVHHITQVRNYFFT